MLIFGQIRLCKVKKSPAVSGYGQDRPCKVLVKIRGYYKKQYHI